MLGTLEMLRLDVRLRPQPLAALGPGHPPPDGAGAAAQQRRAMTTAFIATTGGHLTQLVAPGRADPA
jgi:hypothetical protein